MKTKTLTVLLISAVIVLYGCNAPKENPKAETKPRAVRIETIASRDLPIQVHAVGRLAPDRDVVLSAQVPGILRQYNADVGASVRAGQPLASLDAADYRLALDETKANLKAAQVRLSTTRNNFERARRLLPAKAITPELYEQSEAAFQSAQASVEQCQSAVALAQRRLDKTIITAPFDGYVTQRFVEMGQHIKSGDPAMQLADMETMRVKIYISEKDYVHLDQNDPVTVTVEAFPDTPVAGRVDKIGIQADARTNTFEVEILVDNSQNRLKAGLSARVAIQTEVMHDVVMINQNCIIFREDRKEVFVVDHDHLASARSVQLGRFDGSKVRILDGLMPGDQLVVAGGQYLKQGDKVVVTP